MNCRHCQTPLEHIFVDLGTAPPSNAYLTEKQLSQVEPYYPLKVFVCESCWLVQIDEFAHHSAIFDEQYAYFSSYSSSWLTHAKSYAEMISQRLSLDTDSQVIEIASNDGYLLQYFQQQKIPNLGIEPTASTSKAARDKGIEVLERFFSMELADELCQQNRQADLIVGNNVIAHVPDINDFVQGLARLLKPNGVITLEFPHLLQLVQQCQFDTIYHEHFSYLSLGTLMQVFESQNLRIFDVEQLPTHGGSLRIYGQHREGSQVTTLAVKALLEEEAAAGIRSTGFYSNFQPKVERVKQELCQFLEQARAKGLQVVAYGAAAKGNTLLNYCGIDRELIDYVVDQSPHKQGQYLPGSHIPIFPPDRIKQTRPGYVLILPWNIKHEIVEQHSYIRDWGGRFVTAIPTLDVLS